MYELIFDEVAIDKLEKLPKDIRKRIFAKLRSTKEDPFHFFERLEGRQEYKLRVGDYRVIADIVREKVLILVIYVDHRKNVYKRMN